MTHRFSVEHIIVNLLQFSRKGRAASLTLANINLTILSTLDHLKVINVEMVDRAFSHQLPWYARPMLNGQLRTQRNDDKTGAQVDH